MKESSSVVRRPQSWRDNQSAALKVSQNRPEVRANLSRAVKAAWDSGRYQISEEGAKIRNANLAIGHAIASETCKKSQPLAAAKLRGTNHFGRMQRGRLDHANCKEWSVLSPTGAQYRFTNLLEWCRQNEHLFENHCPSARMPLWKRAASGIANQGSKRGKSCSWNGWVLQKSWEQRDPLQRNAQAAEEIQLTPR